MRVEGSIASAKYRNADAIFKASSNLQSILRKGTLATCIWFLKQQNVVNLSTDQKCSTTSQMTLPDDNIYHGQLVYMEVYSWKSINDVNAISSSNTHPLVKFLKLWSTCTFPSFMMKKYQLCFLMKPKPCGYTYLNQSLFPAIH